MQSIVPGYLVVRNWGRFNRGWIPYCQGKKGGGLNMVSKWSQFEIEQKTTNFAQSKTALS
jgi:hypothetical protein